MLTRNGGYLAPRTDPAPEASRHLQEQGFVVLPKVLDGDGVAALREDVDRVFEHYPPDQRRPAMAADEFRYEMLNRSPAVQELVGHRSILDVVEPLVGEDCHIIANSAWRNPAGREITHGGGTWHCDAGPHIPRPADVGWDDRIPYPIFVIAVHVLIDPMPIECGPTGVIPRSHMSGQAPPSDRRDDMTLTYNDTPVLPLPAEAGDVVAFVSDVWHRRLPTQPGDPGRYFVQIHYGRRDIAQRLQPTADANQLSAEAIDRAGDDQRAKSLIGLHDPFFYDG